MSCLVFGISENCYVQKRGQIGSETHVDCCSGKITNQNCVILFSLHAPKVFTVVQVIVSIAVAAANTKAQVGGHSSASFAAIWSMFMAIIFAGLGGYVVLSGKSSELLVGFLIGVASMMAELFFVLMAFFFTLGEIATTNNYSESLKKLSLHTIYILSIYSFNRYCSC